MRQSFLPCLLLAAAIGLGACEARPVAEETTLTTPTAGLDPVLLARTMEQAAVLPRLHSVIIARDGDILAERAFRGAGLDAPANIKSASKSVLAAVVGAAVGEGVLPDVETPISTWLADDFPPDPDPRLAVITLEHLLTMQAGLGSTSGRNYGAWVSSRNWVRHALARPFEADPGGTMIYSSGTSHLISAVLARAGGSSTAALTRRLLGDPLGIRIPDWPSDPQGVHFGGNDMLMSPRDLLVLGELYRNDGVHHGRRILPEGWVQASWRGRGASRWTGHAYGYGWWIKQARGHEVFYAWGYGGQMLFVVPDLGLTAVMLSDPSPMAERDDHVARLHALLDQSLIPAAERGGAPLSPLS